MAMLNFLNTLEKNEPSISVISFDSVKLGAYVKDSRINTYLFYLDMSNFPHFINISTLKSHTHGGYTCIHFHRSNVETFDWNIDGLNIVFNDLFGLNSK